MAQSPTTSERPHAAAKRYIYAWGDGTAEGNGKMKDLLGGKGAGLAEMTLAGLPTPPGFTITTEACNDYFAAGKQLPVGLWDDVLGAMKQVEEQSGKGFGDRGEPAPGLGPLRRQVLDAGHDGHGPQPRPQRGDAAGPHRAVGQRALRLGRLPPIHRDVRPDRDGREGRALRRAARGPQARPRPRRQGHRPRRRWTSRRSSRVYKQVVREDTGRDFPVDPYEQLDLAVKAVFASWFGKRANDYRTSQKIAHDLGTAVNVVTMVFGNMGDDSGTGVAFTRNTFDGAKELYGEYLVNAQGEDVVAGIRTPQDISQLKLEMPDAYDEFVADRAAARGALPRRAGPRVHHRARQALHAPDAHRQADRRGGREDRRPDGQRGRDHRARGGRAHRACAGRPAPPRPVRPQRPQGRADAWPRASTPPRAPPSAARCSTPTRRSSGSTGARRSSSSASRRPRTTSTAWPWPRAS